MKKRTHVSLESILSPNETVLWEGRPEGIKAMERSYALGMMTRWVICAVLAIGVLYYWLVMSVALSLPQVRVAVSSLVLLGVLAYVCVAPLLAKNNLEKYARYCITNKRVIIYHIGTGFTLMKDLRDVTEVNVHTLATDKSDLVFGPYNNFIKRHMRDDVSAFIGTWKMEPVPFTSIVDVEGALAALPEHVEIHTDRPGGKNAAFMKVA